MTPETKYKIKRCETLLAESPLADEIKKPLIENLNTMSEVHLDQVLRSLERETMELTSLTQLLSSFDQSQDKNWEDLKTKQQEVASQAIDSALQNAKG